MSLAVETLEGDSALAALDDVARLRIAVFRDFPYLYDGNLAYEQNYLARFAAASGAVIVAVRDGPRIVGAATGCPLAAEHEGFTAPFTAAGLDVNGIFYCAESVLLPEYRGSLGHAFFDHREAKARKLGLGISAFCAVIRPDDHPLRPDGYRPLDGFWEKRGYRKAEGLVARFAWTDLGQSTETEKQLQVWMRNL